MDKGADEPPDDGEGVAVAEDLHLSKRPRHNDDKILNVLLAEDVAYKLGLQYIDLLSIPQAQYLWDINPSTSYLYHVVSIILNIPQSEVRLLRQSDGMYRDTTADGWRLVTTSEISLHGTYICKVSNLDSLHALEIDPVKTKGYTISNVSRSSTPVARQETPMPPPSPAVPAVSENQKTSTPPPASAQASVAPPQTPKAKFKTTTDSAFATAVRSRDDNRCIISGTAECTCKASHIIGKGTIAHLLSSLEPGTSVAVGNVFINDPNDPRLGITLEVGLDWDFDDYRASIFVEEDTIEYHIFRNTERPTRAHFTTASQIYAFKRMTKNLGDDRHQLMTHHYRHALINCWGATQMKTKLSILDFTSGEEGNFESEEIDSFLYVPLTPPPSSLS